MKTLVNRSDITGKRIWYRDQFIELAAYHAMCTGKSKLLLDHPFWGFMGLDLVLVEADPSVVKTLATDGYHIFYSAPFVNSLKLGEVEFGIAHEIYHCILDHTEGSRSRRDESWDPKRWNRACDYVINHDLKEARIGEFITTIKILHDPRFAGMSSEEVYRRLEKEDPQPDVDTFDVHIEFDVSGEDGDGVVIDTPTDGEGGEEPGGGPGGASAGNSFTIKVTEKQLSDEAIRWMQTAQRAIAQINQSGADAGSVPAHLRRLIEQLNDPKIHWTSVTRKFMSSIRTAGYSYARPDKRTFGSWFILPAFRVDKQKLTVCVAIDTSGSIGDTILSKFVSELMGIMKAYPLYEVHVFCFEGDVNEATYMKITDGGGSARVQLMEYIKRIEGGGGTAFQSIWDFIRLKKINTKGLVVLTDGYPNDDTWHNERAIPTLFVTVGNPSWKAPFGRTIPFEHQ